MRLSDPTRNRYLRLEQSNVWDYQTVRSARALVVGCGALGNEVAKNLAMLGVKLICLLDRDVVEIANLTRSIFFRVEDHGRPKAEVMAERIREFNPDVEVFPIVGDLERRLGLGLLRNLDLVFCCLDSRLARSLLNRNCERVGVSWVDGAMENLAGEVTAYVPGEGACYECGMPHSERAALAEARSCSGIARDLISKGGIPTLSTMGSIVGAMQVQEAIRRLHEDAFPAAPGSRLKLNCVDNEYYYSTRVREPDCSAHYRFGEIESAAQFTVAKTTAADVLSLFREQTLGPGMLNLGHDVLVSLHCPKCLSTEEASDLMLLVTEERARCPNEGCGTVRQLMTTCTVVENAALANKTLAELGVPPWSIVEVEGADAKKKWYEIAGDAAGFPACLSTSQAVAEAKNAVITVPS